jgi:hypothetical protein
MASASGWSQVKGGNMKKLACLLVALTYGLTNISTWAACVDLSNATNWSNINMHKIIMYRGSKAIAVMEIPFCDIFSSSSIRLDKKFLCKGDKIIVSGISCDIGDIEIP